MRTLIICVALLLALCQARPYEDIDPAPAQDKPKYKHLLIETEDEDEYDYEPRLPEMSNKSSPPCHQVARMLRTAGKRARRNLRSDYRNMCPNLF